eukprot:1876813-Rhodomonas_salina.1
MRAREELTDSVMRCTCRQAEGVEARHRETPPLLPGPFRLSVLLPQRALRFRVDETVEGLRRKRGRWWVSGKGRGEGAVCVELRVSHPHAALTFLFRGDVGRLLDVSRSAMILESAADVIRCLKVIMDDPEDDRGNTDTDTDADTEGGRERTEVTQTQTQREGESERERVPMMGALA